MCYGRSNKIDLYRFTAAHFHDSKVHLQKLPSSCNLKDQRSPLTLNRWRKMTKRSHRSHPLIRPDVVGVILWLSFLLPLPFFGSAQRVVPLGSRLKKRFGGGRSSSGPYFVEQGEDYGVENDWSSIRWIYSVLREIGNRPGLVAVGVAFGATYIFLYCYYRERILSMEKKLLRSKNWDRQLSAGGEFRTIFLSNSAGRRIIF